MINIFAPVGNFFFMDELSPFILIHTMDSFPPCSYCFVIKEIQHFCFYDV